MSSEEPCLTVPARGCLFLRGVTLPYRSSLAAMAEEAAAAAAARGLRGAIIQPCPAGETPQPAREGRSSEPGAAGGGERGRPRRTPSGQVETGEPARCCSLTPPAAAAAGLACARSSPAAAAAAGQSPLLVPRPHVGPRPEPSNHRAPSAWPEARPTRRLRAPLPPPLAPAARNFSMDQSEAKKKRQKERENKHVRLGWAGARALPLPRSPFFSPPPSP